MISFRMSSFRALLPNSTITFTEEVQFFLFSYQLTMITTAIISNSIVVYATTIFNARHLDTSSVLLIQNLAVTDIALILIAYVPKLITLYSGSWTLGPVICYLTAFGQCVPGVVEIITLTCISSFRWFMVWFPFKRPPKAFTTMILILLMWMVAAFFVIVFVTDSKCLAIFDVRNLACTTNVGLHHRYLVLPALFFFGILPVTLTIIFNLLTLGRALSVTPSSPARTYNKQALITVNVICFIFVLTWVPFIIRATMAALSLTLPLWFYTMQYNLNIVSLALNPIVYSITNRKFRRFLFRRLTNTWINIARSMAITRISTPTCRNSNDLVPTRTAG